MDDPSSSSEMLDSMVAAKINRYMTSPLASHLTTAVNDQIDHTVDNRKFVWKKPATGNMARQKLEASVEANLGESREG